MALDFLTGVLALLGLVFAVAVFAMRWSSVQRLPLTQDRSVPKDSPLRGVVYSFTLGMAPWVKESARRHWVAYLRGIAFHIGIFAGLAALLTSPWFDQIPSPIRVLFAAITTLGTLAGVGGGVMRIVEYNLRGISTPDDHAAVWLVTLFLASMTAALLSTSYVPLMDIVAAVMLVYAPLGKIKHCIYFYFGRLFFGYHIGRRGIVRGLEAHSGLFQPREAVREEASHGQ